MASARRPPAAALPWMALLLALSAGGGHAFYLPGVAPNDFQKVYVAEIQPMICLWVFAFIYCIHAVRMMLFNPQPVTVNISSKSLESTESTELQVAMCSAYIRIAKICPPDIWRLGILVDILFSQKPCLPLVDCISVAIHILNYDVNGVNGGDTSFTCDKVSDKPRVGTRRSAKQVDSIKCKHQRTRESPTLPNTNMGLDGHLLARSILKMIEIVCKPLEKTSFVKLAKIMQPFRPLLEVGLPKMTTSNCVFGDMKKDPLQVKVNKLTSTKTQLPYSYYSLPYCRPDTIVDSAENLGEVLRGDRIENSPYVFEMREPQICRIVCKVTLTDKDAKNRKEKIEDEYRVNLILDNLPLVLPLKRMDQDSIIYQLGFPVGVKGQYAGSKDEKYFINNHLSFLVKYHKDVQQDLARIVGFEVKQFSIKHEFEGDWNNDKTRLTTCDPHTKRMVVNSDTPQEVEAKNDVIFTYDVEFKESDVKWASRWDTYLFMTDDQIHWFSIVNSLMIVLFLSGMVAMIMLRTLYRDISKYNQLETQEEAQEETGWKLVHGDVFRPPTNSDLLCVYVGTGVQFFGMLLVTMIFAVLGFLSPSNRGGLMTAMLLLWVFMGLFAGYSSARLYKMFKGAEWKKITLGTAFMFPGVVFALFFVLNALIWGEKSSGALPFTTMFALILLWFGISVPLVYIGSYVGFKKPAIEDPVKTNKIPRQIPEQAWYMNPIFSILIGGILPFGAVFIELFFILTSIWLHQFYYIFGFLFLVFIILIVTCAEITIVLCYFQLCSEDYLWWWRSYLTAGSSALYLFLYATFYFFTKLEITKLVSGVLYFGYMLIASYAFFVLTGTIGFYACFWFTRLIYSSVKID